MAVQYDPRLTPWQTRASEFRTLLSPEEKVLFLLQYAVMAPSSHNTQPWKFGVSGGQVDIYADYGRRLPSLDPGDRELIMSVGAALMNLRVAAAHFGYRCDIRYCPDATPDSERLASVLLALSADVDIELGRLFPAIPLRRTNRVPYLPVALKEEDQILLRGITGTGLADLQWIDEPDAVDAAAALVAQGDRFQMAKPALRYELASLVRTDTAGQGEQAAVDGVGMSDLRAWGSCWYARSLDVGRVMSRRNRRLALDASALIVLVGEDVRESLLEAGQLLEQFLLTATFVGVQYSFLNQPIQVSHLRPRLRDLLCASSWPQLLLRVGYAEPVAHTMPRRPVASVLLAGPKDAAA